MVSSASNTTKKTLKVGISELENNPRKSLDHLSAAAVGSEEGAEPDEEGGNAMDDQLNQEEKRLFSNLEVNDPETMAKIIDLVKQGPSQMESVL
jgi:hypothetical protein